MYTAHYIFLTHVSMDVCVWVRQHMQRQFPADPGSVNASCKCKHHHAVLTPGKDFTH